MTQDLNALLQKLRELRQAVDEPGRLTPAQLEMEVRRITGTLQQALANLSNQFPQETSPETSYMLQVFQAQVSEVLTNLDQSGLEAEHSEDSENLSQDLEL